MADRPRFGDKLRNSHASESNPQRDGFYVETVERTGRLNPGTFYRITDGSGAFWETPADSVCVANAAPALDVVQQRMERRIKFLRENSVEYRSCNPDEAFRLSCMADEVERDLLSIREALQGADVAKSSADWLDGLGAVVEGVAMEEMQAWKDAKFTAAYPFAKRAGERVVEIMSEPKPRALESRAPTDADRLDWLQTSAATLHCNFIHPDDWTLTTGYADGRDKMAFTRNSVRECIDAAMSAEVVPASAVAFESQADDGKPLTVFMGWPHAIHPHTPVFKVGETYDAVVVPTHLGNGNFVIEVRPRAAESEPESCPDCVRATLSYQDGCEYKCARHEAIESEPRTREQFEIHKRSCALCKNDHPTEGDVCEDWRPTLIKWGMADPPASKRAPRASRGRTNELADRLEQYVNRNSLGVTPYSRALFAQVVAALRAESEPRVTLAAPADAEIDSACMWFRHDFGLLDDAEKDFMRFTAKEWLRAWCKVRDFELTPCSSDNGSTE